jgi:AmiR/NasT family two-component response regulator
MPKVTTSSVLIAAPSESIAAKIRTAFPEHMAPVSFAPSMTVARQKLERENYDLLLIYSPLPDESGVQTALELAEERAIGILLFVKPEVYEQVSYAARDSGIFVLSRPASRTVIAEAIRMLLSMQKRVAALMAKNATLHRKLGDQRLIGRAKCLLVEFRGMSEPEAHHYLEKLAMDSCITKREAAQDIIRRLEAETSKNAG